MSGSQTHKTGQRKVRTEMFRFVTASLTTVQATNTTAITEGTYKCTAKLTSAGIVAVQLNSPFARVPIVQATAEDGTQKVFCVVAGNTLAGLITINCFADTGTATSPTALHLVVNGCDTTDQI